jgi:hypothetical protein
VVEKLQKERDNLLFDIEVGFASETGEVMERTDYFVFPKELKRWLFTIPIYWYTFTTLREAKTFMRDMPKTDSCFVDYCF